MMNLRSLPALACWVLLCFSAAAAGILFPPGEWYQQLTKPAWNPPAWLFGPVWTALYLMMAVAAWRVWRQGGWLVQRRPLGLFVTQLGLNALWSPLFFGLKNPGLALLEIIGLLVAIVYCLRAFSRVDKPAAVLLLPYLGWVTFAAFLNGVLWRLNP